jgi:hypothetical protein
MQIYVELSENITKLTLCKHFFVNARFSQFHRGIVKELQRERRNHKEGGVSITALTELDVMSVGHLGSHLGWRGVSLAVESAAFCLVTSLVATHHASGVEVEAALAGLVPVA